MPSVYDEEAGTKEVNLLSRVILVDHFADEYHRVEQRIGYSHRSESFPSAWAPLRPDHADHPILHLADWIRKLYIRLF